MPPPCPGFLTVMVTVLGVPTRLAGTAAASLDGLRKVVGSGFPFQNTIAVGAKSEPDTCSVKSAVPGLTLEG